MIESQHNPDILLDHIRSDQWVDHRTRLWAVEKAIALGVDRNKLRSALLDHARHASADTRLNADVARLGRLAADRGILKSGELSLAVGKQKGRTHGGD